MDGASGTASSATVNISVTVEPRITLYTSQVAKSNDPSINILKTVELKNGVQVVVYIPSSK